MRICLLTIPDQTRRELREIQKLFSQSDLNQRRKLSYKRTMTYRKLFDIVDYVKSIVVFVIDCTYTYCTNPLFLKTLLFLNLTLVEFGCQNMVGCRIYKVLFLEKNYSTLFELHFIGCIQCSNLPTYPAHLCIL